MTQSLSDDGTHDAEDEDSEDEDPHDQRWERWPATVVATVAREVRRRREELGWSQHQLADACQDAGYAIPRNIIANLESGRRESLQVIELLILARALRWPPAALLFPVGYVEGVHPYPGRLRNAMDAVDWLSGADNHDTGNYWYREYHETYSQRGAHRYNLSTCHLEAEEESNPERRRELLAKADELARTVASLNADITRIKAEIAARGLLPLEEWIPTLHPQGSPIKPLEGK